RERVLAHLRRWPGSGVGALARELELAPMTVRHHLARLEAAGLVSGRQETRRRPVGRPALVYSLTPEGDDYFPKAYDRLARLFLDELIDRGGNDGRSDPSGAQPGEEQRRLLMERLARRLVEQHRARLERLEGRARVREAASILEEESGFTEVREQESALEVAGYNCPYRRLLRADDDDVCRFHTQYVSELMAVPVQLVECQRTGAAACCFRADLAERPESSELVIEVVAVDVPAWLAAGGVEDGPKT
ncbi:MAG: ArsR family transcriptional regulator, partial [Candidatus Acidoferrales bacterium]